MDEKSLLEKSAWLKFFPILKSFVSIFNKKWSNKNDQKTVEPKCSSQH